MQGMKKTLVALLAVAMVLSLVAPVLAAPADVAGTKYEDAAVRLIALGIFKGDDKGDFNPGAVISRTEATAVIVRALGLEKSAELMNGVTKFPDVNADAGLQWATGAINIAVSSGIVNGYPDGQFGGRDNVTYAQLAKMILYALGYGVTVEGGVWPTAVLAKADDLDILDGLSIVADAPITRGDAAKMLDNGLDVPSLKQTGYGDLKQFEETGKSLLGKMGLDEIEGRVVEIPAVEDGLDADEVTIEVTKVNGTSQTAKDETYAQIDGVDAQGLFGLQVKAWVKDGDIVFVEKKSADKDVLIDSVSDNAKAAGPDFKLELKVLDDDVTFAAAPTIYVNNKATALGTVKIGSYGRFVKKDNKVVFANLYEFDASGVVISADKNKVKYFTTTEKARTLDLSDADAVYVYNADLSSSSLSEIDEDDVLYWWSADDEYYLVVAGKKVEGTLEKIKGTKVTIDGKGYTLDSADKATYSTDNDKNVKLWADTADDLDDLYDEEVVALLDLNGHVRHIRGDVKATSGTQYGVVVGAPSDDEVTIFNVADEDVTYEIAKKADWDQLALPGGAKYYGSDAGLAYQLIAYKLDSKGKILESDVTNGLGIKAAVEVAYSAAAVAQDWATPVAAAYDNVVKAAKGDRVITHGASTYYIDQSTVVIRTVNNKGSLDPEVIEWDDFKDLVLTNITGNQAAVFGDPGKAAKAIFFLNKAFAGAQDDDYFGVVTDTWRADGKNWVEVDVYDEGKVEYVVSTGSFGKGDIVKFRLNAKGELVDQTPTIAENWVEEIDGYYVTIGATDGKFDPDAVAYSLDSKEKLDKKIDVADIDEMDYIQYVVHKDLIKVVLQVTSKAVASDQEKADAVAADIAGTFTTVGAAGATSTPDVPEGFTIAAKSTSDATVYDVPGVIAGSGTADVVFTVTHTASGKTADTATVVVTVP